MLGFSSTKQSFLQSPNDVEIQAMGRLRALRVLVYARLKGLENDTRVVEHLKKHSDAARTLGLSNVSERTTVGRW